MVAAVRRMRLLVAVLTKWWSCGFARSLWRRSRRSRKAVGLRRRLWSQRSVRRCFQRCGACVLILADVITLELCTERELSTRVLVVSSSRTVKGQYQMTNKPPPTAPSSYVANIVRCVCFLLTLVTTYLQELREHSQSPPRMLCSPLGDFFGKWGVHFAGASRQQLFQAILDDVSELYGSLSAELLKSAQELEESLKSRKMQRNVASSLASGASVSDTDKMRMQLRLDLQEMQRCVFVFYSAIGDRVWRIEYGVLTWCVQANAGAGLRDRGVSSVQADISEPVVSVFRASVRAHECGACSLPSVINSVLQCTTSSRRTRGEYRSLSAEGLCLASIVLDYQH